MYIFRNISEWYAKFERPISSLSLIGGFVFDAVTLTRVDMLKENLWVLVHLTLAGIFIILINQEDNAETEGKDQSRSHFWLLNGMQFVFGGLLSTFLVFYFRSGSIWVSWPFLLILCLAFFANERLKHHYARLTFQISFFYLSLFSFCIFVVPIVVHQLGGFIFFLSGILSLILVFCFISILYYVSHENSYRSKHSVFYSIVAIYAFMNILYFFHLIPPIPLSLKSGRIYHSVSRNGAGNYEVTYEDTGLQGYFTLYNNVHIMPGDVVYAYSAIFSPTDLNTIIIHDWQYQDATGIWMSANRIELAVVGGRDNGFRTYSLKRAITPGKWRVNIETEQGQLLGRILLNIVLVNNSPSLFTKIEM